MGQNPRAPQYIQRDSPVSKEIQKLMSQNIDQVKRMGVQIKDPLFFEDKYSSKVQYYLVTSKLVELYTFIGIIGYLIALYLVL